MTTSPTAAKTRHTAGGLLLVASSASAARIPRGCTFALWSDLLPKDVLPFIEVAKTWQLPRLSDSESKTLLLDYSNLIADIGLVCGRDSVWWYTWTSSRDRFHSFILADLELIARFKKACREGLPYRLVMFCNDPHLARALRTVAGGEGIKTQVALGDRLCWAGRRIRMKAKPLYGAVRICGRWWLTRVRLRKIKFSLEQAKQQPERTILVTYVKEKNLVENQPTTDTFFGPLPQFLSGPNRSTVVFGDLLDGLPQQQNACQVDSPSPVVVAASLVTVRSLLSALIRGFLARPPVQLALKSQEPYLGPLVKRDLSFNRDSIVYGLLMESGLRQLVKRFQPTQMIHMCENNPWERACQRAIAAANPKPRVSGYMHCAVILSHTKIIITDRERPVRPNPDRLICIGDRARDIMVREGGHAPGEVIGACALRHGYLADMQPRNKLNRPVKNILVVLEGLPTMSHLVRFVYEALDAIERFQTVIRPHPAFSLDRILDGAGLSIADFKTLKISEHPHIMQDFEDADLVVYKGSTAAIEAGYLGIPLIHYAHPNLLTDDPLFEVGNLKEVAATPEDLIPAIEKLSSMSDEDFLLQHGSLRKYLDEYLTPPRPEFASAFLPDPPKGEAFA